MFYGPHVLLDTNMFLASGCSHLGWNQHDTSVALLFQRGALFSRLQPQHPLYSPVNQTKAEVWQVRKRGKLDTPVATAHSNPWCRASRGRGGHSYQNTTTLIPPANLDSLLDTDKSQHKEKNQWKMCFYTAWPPKVAKKALAESVELSMTLHPLSDWLMAAENVTTFMLFRDH